MELYHVIHSYLNPLYHIYKVGSNTYQINYHLTSYENMMLYVHSCMEELIYRLIGMGSIDILVCDYWETKYPNYHVYWFSCVYFENCLYTCVKLSTNVSKHCKTCHDMCHDFTILHEYCFSRFLLLVRTTQ